MNLVCLVLKLTIFLSTTEINMCGNTFGKTFHNEVWNDLDVDLMKESAISFILLKRLYNIG